MPEVGIDLYLVKLRGATAVANTAITAARPVIDNTVTEISGDYVQYCALQGNVLSYQEDKIGRTMAGLFSALDSDARQDFVTNGEDFSTLYTENDIASIAARFGENLFGPNASQPYLEFTCSETANEMAQFQSTSAFAYGGGAYIDGSSYGGLAWSQDITTEMGFSFLGDITISAELFKTDGTLMFGTQWSTALTTTTTSTSNWGVSLSTYKNSLAPGESYTVRMYFLKSSPLWARELSHFSASNEARKIDFTNSAPIRVLFTVTNISPALRARLHGMFPH